MSRHVPSMLSLLSAMQTYLCSCSRPNTNLETYRSCACMYCLPSTEAISAWCTYMGERRQISHKLNTSRTSCKTCYMSLFYVDMYGQAVTMASRRTKQRDSLVTTVAYSFLVKFIRSWWRRMSYRAVDWMSDRPRRSLQYVDMCK
jgi:hypothetical protein